MSQALYRKYRPQRFDDVIGQDVAVRTLRNAIEQDRVAHAYLFTGTKGTGKTTLAKLLAKAMNCDDGPTTSPCGECSVCVSIAEGRSMDVVEIDAASTRGIDDVREKIIDTVAFQPSHGSRRVYILDEAHQLTPAAFNALLKTIEEPPPHVLFVFCTTELHQMMATVRDRCQRVTMRSPGPDMLLEALRRVCKREEFETDEATLRVIARASQGSFRNALGTLEMLATTFGTTFGRDEVLAHLGVVSEEALFSVVDAVIDGSAKDVLELIEQLVQDGVDLEQFARAAAEHIRGVVLALHGVDDHGAVTDHDRIAKQAQRADEAKLLAAIDCIGDAVTRIRVGSDTRIAVETSLVRACQGLGLPLLALRLAALEHKIDGSYGGPLQQQSSGAASVPARAPVQAAPQATAPTKQPESPAAAASSPAATPPAAVNELDAAAFAKIETWWPRVVKRVATKPALKAMVGQLQPVRVTETHVVVQPTSPVPATSMLRNSITEAVKLETGHDRGVDVLDVAPAPAASAEPRADKAAAPAITPAAPAPAPPSPSASASSDEQPADADEEGVSNLMSMFDATHVPAPGDEPDQ